MLLLSAITAATTLPPARPSCHHGGGGGAAAWDIVLWAYGIVTGTSFPESTNRLARDCLIELAPERPGKKRKGRSQPMNAGDEHVPFQRATIKKPETRRSQKPFRRQRS